MNTRFNVLIDFVSINEAKKRWPQFFHYTSEGICDHYDITTWSDELGLMGYIDDPSQIIMVVLNDAGEPIVFQDIDPQIYEALSE